MILSDEQFALIAARDAEIDHLRARCSELNEACSAKQALLDHVAADERDFMELVEGYKRERDAEHLSRLSSDEQMRFQIKRAEGLRAEVARQDAEIAALTERFVPLVEENERLRAEVAELTAELEKWKAMVGVGTKEDAETIATLRAEAGAIRRAAEAVCKASFDDRACEISVFFLIDKLRAALAQPAATGEGCPDGVENCPGDCTGAPANYTGVVPNAPYPTGHECDRCSGTGILKGAE